MDRARAESVTIDLAGFVADPWSRAGLTVVDDLTRAGHFGNLVRLAGHGVPAELDDAVHERAATEHGRDGAVPAIHEWAERMAYLGRWVMRAVALGLGQPIDAFEAAIHPDLDRTVLHLHHGGPRGLLGTAGADAGHQDDDLLTVVHIDHDAVLEVAHGERWEPVDVVPGSYVVLFGTELERVSRGYLRATTHRVRELLPGHGHHVVACRLSLLAGSDIDPVLLPPPLDRRAAGRNPAADERADQA